MASQITSLTVVYSTVYSDADQRKHQSSASLAFVWGSHRDRWIPRTKGQLRGKCFHLMTSSFSYWDQWIYLKMKNNYICIKIDTISHRYPPSTNSWTTLIIRQGWVITLWQKIVDLIIYWRFNSLRPSDGYICRLTNHQWFRQWLVAWTAPISQPVLDYY